MHRIAYYRVSTRDQSIESQRQAMGGAFDREVMDEGVSGAVLARDRPGLGGLLESLLPGQTLYVFAVDRLGRDAIDVQTTVRDLMARGVGLHVHGLGRIEGEVGQLILAVLAQVASMERNRIIERTQAGLSRAKADGKRLGRPASLTAEQRRNVARRLDEGAAVSALAREFETSRQSILRVRNSMPAS